MQNLQNILIELLKDDSNYTSEGKLLKNKLTEDALKLEPSLLKYLLNNDRLKKHFFIDVDLSKFEEDNFSKLELDQQKEVLIECLDKNHLYVNLSEIDDTTYNISDEDKTMNKKFYGLD